MTEPKDGGKRQASFYVEDGLIKRLDRWLKRQKEERNYEIDRSHVVNILLRRFLDKNEPDEPDKTD